MDINYNVISCKNIVKKYSLYSEKIDRLKEVISPSNKKYHRDFYALNDVTFSITKGECVGIVGQNGSGKSTLLKIITGIITPTSGQIQVNGNISALLELGAGFNPEYTGYENIYLNGTIMGYSKKEMDQKIPEIIKFADIGDFINQPVKIYSSGMFVRLAFAVAISVEPDILIIDEALAVGDMFFQLKCYKQIDDFKKQGKTILFVSHDQSSIIKYCDRALLLNNGNILCDDIPKKVIDEYKKVLVNNDKSSNSNQVVSNKFEEQKDWKSYYITNVNFLEYGNQEAEIIDFGIFDNDGNIVSTYYKNQEYEIRMKVFFKSTVDSPIFAISFKDMSGLEVAGTNTMQEGIETNVIESGQIVIVKFKHKFSFQNYPLFLSFGCSRFSSNGSLEVLHRIYDILHIKTVGGKITNGFFDLNCEVNIDYE